MPQPLDRSFSMQDVSQHVTNIQPRKISVRQEKKQYGILKLVFEHKTSFLNKNVAYLVDRGMNFQEDVEE